MSNNRKIGNRILVFAAHPDDEVLGCGGTIAFHRSKGNAVGVCYLSEGISSRLSLKEFENKNAWSKDLNEREQMAKNASKILDFEIIDFLRLPNLRLKNLPLLDITKQLIKIIKDFQPDTVYVNFPGDLNSDHGVMFEATYAALRPSNIHDVKNILCYEVLSSTEWAPNIYKQFNPDTFINISNFFTLKMQSVKAYEFEMRAAPHPRSNEIISALAMLRGSQVGVKYAESFMSIRRLIK